MPKQEVELSVSVGEESTSEPVPPKRGELKGGATAKEGCMAVAMGCGITLFPGVAAAAGAIAGATGAGILKAASDTYDPRHGAEAGASGSAVLAIPVTLALYCFACAQNNMSSTVKRNCVAALAITAAVLTAVSGGAGQAMGHGGDMDAGQSTTATALGTAALAVVAAAATAVVCRFS